MSEAENPAATLARLLKMNLHVVKDNGALANINVSTEYPNFEAFKGFDGQVTVGVAETSDQKLELSGRTRKRTSALRVNVWAVEQPNGGESAKVLRDKIAAEINRVIQLNRVSLNVTAYDFFGLGAGSQTHMAYMGTGEAAPFASDAWTELSGEEYEKLWSNDQEDAQVSTGNNGEYAVALFGFKVDNRRNAVEKAVLAFEGNGTAPAGNGVTVKAWNSATATWGNGQSAVSDGTVVITLNADLPNFIDEDGYIWCLARTSNASDGQAPAVLNCNYASCTVTVKGITYCDVVSYRDADRVDVKPFIYRTEFSVKSWFFEKTGA